MFLLKNAALAAMLCASCVTSAVAMGRGQDANEVPVINPETHQATEIWRLSGYFPTLGVSAVQISPGWIMSSKHAAPPAGTMFGNGFGVARVEVCHTYPAANVDLALCKLQKKVNTPVGFKFPLLVESPIALANSRSVETLARDMGQFLAVGYGAPNLGLPMFAWTDLISMPLVDGSPDVIGLRAPAPYADGGDSGSPLFWFSSKTEKVGLMGLHVMPGSVGPFTSTNSSAVMQQNTLHFSMPLLDWIASKVAENGMDSVQVSSALNFHGNVVATPSWIGRGSLKFVSSTASAVDLKWSAPKSNAADVKKYLVYIIQDGQTTRSGFVNSNVTSYSAVGLTTGVDSLACVSPSGTGGFAPFGTAQQIGSGRADISWELDYSCAKFRLEAAPSVIQGLDIKIVDRDFGASGVWPSEVITWTRPASPAQPVKIYYQLKSTVDGETPTYKSIKDGEVSKGPIRTVKGQKICVSVTSYTGPATVGQTSEQKCAVVN